MSRIIVLGAGMVGSAIAKDLSKNHHVTAIDNNPEALKIGDGNDNLFVQQADLSKPKVIKSIVDDYDIVVGAVPGFMGFETLKAVIEAGKNVIDISFFPEDPFELDELAKSKNVTAVMDCGVAPGVSNLIIGHHSKLMDLNNFECYVGGLPKNKVPPFEYKAPFSPIDVIEEYTRPARFVENGVVVIKEALSGPEIINLPPVGDLQAFNTDGLRSLITTIKCENMKEKTLRYPGHIDKIKILQQAGFFSQEPMPFGDSTVKPIDMTARVLFDQWALQPEEEEFTIMKIIVEGLENGITKKYEYDLFDEYDSITKTSSMARTTGYTCTAVANLVLESKYETKGISPPEYIGMHEGCLDYIMEYLSARGINYHQREA